MFVMVSASGLMATAQIAPIAADFKVGYQIVFWGATTLTAAFEPALHGEGDFGVPGSDRKPCEDIDRQLAHGVCGHRPDEFHRGGACLVCAQAAAAADARRALNFGKGAPC
jgi:hypothetical protein